MTFLAPILLLAATAASAVPTNADLVEQVRKAESGFAKSPPAAGGVESGAKRAVFETLAEEWVWTRAR